MNEVKKWIDEDSHDALFGQSSRMRSARTKSDWFVLPVMSRWWKAELSEIGRVLRESTGDQTDTKTASTDNAPPKSQAATNPKDLKQHRMGHSSAPLSSTTPAFDGPLEYDPISNRMVRVSDKAFSHYGQELDLGNGVPRESSLLQKDVGLDLPETAPKARSDPQTEFQKYKSSRFQSLDSSKSEETPQMPTKHNTVSAESTLDGGSRFNKGSRRTQLDADFEQIQIPEIDLASPRTWKPYSKPRTGAERPAIVANPFTESASETGRNTPKEHDISNSSSEVETVVQSSAVEDPAIHWSAAGKKEYLECLEKELEELDDLKVSEQKGSKNEPIPNKPDAREHDTLPEASPVDAPKGFAMDSAAEPPTAKYTVLAYDPSSCQVTSATLNSPPRPGELPIPLTIALRDLSEPAKFLPYLNGLRNSGFVPVSSGNNLLVLRELPATTYVSEKGDGQVSTNTSVSPTGFNQDTSNPKVVDSGLQGDSLTKAAARQQMTEPKGFTFKHHRLHKHPHRIARRTEPVFSGGARHRDPRHWRRRFWRAAKSLSASFGLLVAVIYLVGLGAELTKAEVKRHRVVHKSGRPRDDE